MYFTTFKILKNGLLLWASKWGSLVGGSMARDRYMFIPPWSAHPSHSSNPATLAWDDQHFSAWTRPVVCPSAAQNGSKMCCQPMNPVLGTRQGRLPGAGSSCGCDFSTWGFDLGSVQHPSPQPGQAALPSEQALYVQQRQKAVLWLCAQPPC